MQIQNHHIMTSNRVSNAAQPNVGEELHINVIERVDNQQAVVSMKGTTATVTFEGNVPEQGNVLIEITGKTPEGNYTVKVSERNATTTSLQQAVPQTKDSQVSEAVKTFTSRGITITKENTNAIEEFLTNGKGTTEQKMDTLRMMAQKQINVSDTTLKSVHESLSGKPLSESLISVLDELGVDFQPSRETVSEKSLATVRTEVQREPDVAKASKIVEDYLKNANLNESSKKTLEKSVLQAKRLAQVGQAVNAKVQLVQNLVVVEKQNKNSHINTNETALNMGRPKDSIDAGHNDTKAVQETAKMQQPIQAKVTVTNALTQTEQQAQSEAVPTSEVIRQVKEKVTQEPNLTRALDQVKEVVKTASLPSKVVEQLEKVVQDTAKLQQTGQTAQARVNLTNALTQIEAQAQPEVAASNRSSPSSKRKSSARAEFDKGTGSSKGSSKNSKSTIKTSRTARKSGTRYSKITSDP